MITSASAGGTVPCRVPGRPLCILSEGQWGSVETEAAKFCGSLWSAYSEGLVHARSPSSDDVPFQILILPASLFCRAFGSDWPESDLGLRTWSPKLIHHIKMHLLSPIPWWQWWWPVLRKTLKSTSSIWQLGKETSNPSADSRKWNAHLKMPRREQKSSLVVMCGRRGVC